MREILVAAGVVAGDGRATRPVRRRPSRPHDARLALDVYVHRLRAGIGAMAAALGGLDALVFTGGVGENSPEVRRSDGRRPRVPGAGRRRGAQRGHGEAEDRDVERRRELARSPSSCESREDLEIARAVRRLLDPAQSGDESLECRPAA